MHKIIVGLLVLAVILSGCINNPQIKCLGTCNCMEKCNERGTYFIPVDANSECSGNSTNKTCCCSGV